MHFGRRESWEAPSDSQEARIRSCDGDSWQDQVCRALTEGMGASEWVEGRDQGSDAEERGAEAVTWASEGRRTR